MTLAIAGWLLAGLALLVGGAELLVRGASRLAARLGIPPLVVGLTVVAAGTSAPEVAVSVGSAIAGEPGVALGNVVGSNVFNVLLILGLSAVIVPLVVARQLVRLDVPFMVAVSLLVLVLALDGRIGVAEGAILLVLCAGYVALLVRLSRRGSAGVSHGQEAAAPRPPGGLVRNAGAIVLGLGLLVVGSRALLRGAVDLAAALEIDPVVVGLTVIAGGTSLPEVATSVAAALRGERDIAVGNVVGSNVFNLLLVLGAAAVAGGGLPVDPGLVRLDLPVMAAVAVACLPIFATGHEIARWEGAVFLGYYAAYTAYLVLEAKQHAALPVLGGVMLGIVVPLTVLTLAVVSIREWRARR